MPNRKTRAVGNRSHTPDVHPYSFDIASAAAAAPAAKSPPLLLENRHVREEESDDRQPGGGPDTTCPSYVSPLFRDATVTTMIDRDDTVVR